MAKLNLEKLLKTDFIDRFLGFLEKYDEVRDTYIYHRAQKWINEKNFDSIRYFLNTTPIETSLPISLNQFVSMNYEDFLCLQAKYSQLSAIIDEKKALYQEFMSFYE